MTGVFGGDNQLSKAYRGTTEITKIYAGTRQVFPESEPPPPVDGFHDLLDWHVSWIADDLSPGLVSAWTNGQGTEILSPKKLENRPSMSLIDGVNGEPGVVFNSSNQTHLMKTFSESIPSPFSMVLIGRVTSIGNWILDTPSLRHFIYFSGSTLVFGGNGSSGTMYDPNGPLVDPFNYALTVVYNDTNSVVRSSGVEAIGNLGLYGLTALSLGGDYRGDVRNSNAVISAIGYIPGNVLNNPAYSNVQAWALSKYNVTL